MRIDRLDHLVLTAADVDATVAFYTRVLGMEEVTFEGGRRALRSISTYPAPDLRVCGTAARAIDDLRSP